MSKCLLKRAVVGFSSAIIVTLKVYKVLGHRLNNILFEFD